MQKPPRRAVSFLAKFVCALCIVLVPEENMVPDVGGDRMRPYPSVGCFRRVIEASSSMGSDPIRSERPGPPLNWWRWEVN